MSIDRKFHIESLADARNVRAGEAFVLGGLTYKVRKGGGWTPSDNCLLCGIQTPSCDVRACCGTFRVDCADVYFERV